MKYFDDVLEKQDYYNKLRVQKRMVNRDYNCYNEIQQYSRDSVSEFLDSVYSMAMSKNEIKLSGVFIR